ncbi:MAG: MFS transporter [Spirochaetia bacterium]|nr:MFS transporter [Spirochaetia bacterium]
MATFKKDKQFYKFAFYGFLKNIRFTDPFIVLFFIESGLSYTLIGLLVSIRSVLVNVFEIPSGIFADSYGRRKAMLICFTSYICSFLIFYFFTGFTLYVVGMLFFALGEAFRTGTHKAIILEHLRRNNLLNKKLEYYGYTRSWSQLGSAFSALGAAALVFVTGNYRIVFISSVIPYIIALLLIASYPPNLDFSDDERSVKGDLWKRYKETLHGVIILFTNSSSRKGFLNSGLYGGIFKSVKDYIQPVLVQAALTIPIFLFLDTEKRPPVMIGFAYVGIYLLTSTASKRSSKFVKKGSCVSTSINVLFYLSALCIILSGVFLSLGVSGAAVIFFVVLFVFQNLRRPMEVDYLSNLIDRKAMASGLSVESQFKSLVTAIAAPLIGGAIDSFGLSAALIVTGGVTLIGGCFFRLACLKNT